MTDMVDNPAMTDRFGQVCDQVAGILAGVLDMDESKIDRDKDFFEIGGSSVLVPEVARQVASTFGIAATSILLYENPEIGELAHAIIELQDQDTPPAAGTGLIPCRTDRGRAPASFGQQQLWFLEQLVPEACAYNVVAGFRVHGPLSVDAFRRALRAVAARHDVLRSAFEVHDGAVVQVVRDIDPPVVEVDAGEQDWAAVEQRLPFDLAAGPLLRARVVRHAEDDHTIYLSMHHIITDDRSSDLLVGEIVAFYGEFTGGPAADVPTLTVQYGDMAAWQRESLTGSVAAEQLDYWRTALGDAPLVLDLPADRPRPPVQSFAGAVVRRRLTGGADVLAKAAALGKRVGATPFMVLISAFGGLLARWSDVDDVLIGTPIADRDDEYRQSMLGFLLNTVVMRVRTGDDPRFTELVTQVREAALGAYTHQHIPFDQVVEMLAPQRELSRNPVAQVMFILHAGDPQELALRGLRVEPVEVEPVTAKFDLTLSLIPLGDELIAEWEYATDLFDRATIESLAGAFDTLLDVALSTPDVPVSGLPLPAGADEARSALSYWRDNLAGERPVLALPSDRPRRSAPAYRAATHEFVLDTGTTRALHAFAEREAVPVSAVVTAVYQTLLARLGRTGESIVGAPVSDRPALEGPIAASVNTVCLRTAIGKDDDLRSLARLVADVSAKALAHMDIPFERVVDAVAPQEEPGVPPLFQAMVVCQNSPLPPSSSATTTKLDLTLFATNHDDRLHCAMEYNADLFDADRIERWGAMLVSLLTGALANPAARMTRLPLADVVLPEPAPAPDVSRTVVDLVAGSVAEWPDQTACVHDGRQWTYRELDERARLILSAMRCAGWSAGGVVAVAVDRGMDLPAALLAVLRLGSAYLPVDPGQPAHRIEAMLADAGCRRALVSRPVAFGGCEVLDLGGDLDARQADTAAAVVAPEDAAYVIFTSGSTGRPKGVQVPHRALAAVLQDFAALLATRPGERWLSVTRPTFDIAALELFLPLAFGGELEIASDDALADPTVLADRLSAGGVDVVQGTPTLWRAVVNGGWSGTAGLRLLCGGEELSPDLADDLVSRANRVWNVYGPTETTVWSTVAELGSAPLSLGMPLPGEQVYVVDDDGTPVPVGVIGELWIGGIGVADGYVNRDDLTAQRFGPDPFQGTGRVYRTGDLVEWRPDGSLRFHGRLDQQVKLRGHRIEPAEIESVLRSAPGVGDAAVVLRQDAVRGAELVAFVQPDLSGAAPDPGDLVRYCAERLPAVMVPGAIQVLAALPTTPSGKIDRPALARTEIVAHAGLDDRTRAEGTTELAVAEVFGELLAIADVPASTSFFALGGHSLLAAQAMNWLRGKGFTLSLRDLFSSPTVRGLAAVLRQGSESSGVARTGRTGDLPLAFVQERLWFDAQVDPDGHHYHIGGALRMRGSLALAILRDQLRAVVARHEPLRSRFVDADGTPAQQVADDVPVDIQVEDVSDALDPLAAARDRATGMIATPFRLAEPPLFRFRLYRLADDDHLFVVCLHHIVADGWSMGVLAEEVVSGYSAAVAGWQSTVEQLPIRYRDYVAWERDPARAAVIDERTADVVDRLRGFPAYSSIPLDRARPKRGAHVGGTVRDRLDPGATRVVRDLAGECGSTLHSVLLAGFAALLHRHGAGTELVLACPSANRPHRDFEGLVGAFVNTLPVPITCGPAVSFADLVTQVGDSMLAALRGEDVPFERIVSALGVPRNLAFPPLTQIAFVSQNAPMPDMRMPGIVVEPVPLDPGIALYDLRLAVTERDGGVDLQLDHDVEVLDESTARILLDRYVAAFELLAVQPQPGSTPFPVAGVAPAEEAPVNAAPATTVVARLREICAVQPDAPAVSCGAEVLTFAELDRRSTALAARLREHGAGPGSVVAIALPRGIPFAVALPAVLKTGAAYTALDDSMPTARIRFVVEDCGAGVVLGDPHAPWAAELPVPVITAEHGDALDPAPLPEPGINDVAVLVYTSGSTGTPKGTRVPHRALIGFWRAADYADFGPGHVFLGHSATSWDGNILEFWGAVLSGGRCHLVPAGLSGPDALALHRAEGDADTVWLTAAMFNAVVDADLAAFRGLTQVLIGGEALSPEHVRRFRDRFPDIRLVNGYGPSECTVFATCFVIPEQVPAAWPSIPIGTPVGDRRVRVLDESGEPVPDLVPGELYIGGDAVALGYLGRPELTAARFVGTPGDRWYRTGDLVRRRIDGNLEFVGRTDEQVKLRGFRIEPGEIEHVLVAAPGVRTAAVAVYQPGHGTPRLAAYVTLEPGVQGDVGTRLREHLRERLPEYMVPGSVDVLAELPRTATGKLDRAALPAPSGQRETQAGAPGTEREIALAAIIARTLDLPQVGIEDNYFDIGGDSIASIQIVSKAREIHIVLDAKDFFDHQTVRALAAVARDGQPAEVTPEAADTVLGDVPLGPMQRWLFGLGLTDPNRFTQSVLLEFDDDPGPGLLSAALSAVVARHPLLRARFSCVDGQWRQECVADADIVVAADPDRRPRTDAEIDEIAARAQDGIDLEHGPLLRAVWVGQPTGCLLALVAHHLVVDGLSWRIIAADLAKAVADLRAGAQPALPAATTSYGDWVRLLDNWRSSPQARRDARFWRAQQAAAPVWPDGGAGPRRDLTRDLLHGEIVTRLIRDVPMSDTSPSEVLLAALVLAVLEPAARSQLVVEVEHHGRGALADGASLDRTVGWFTSLYPVLLDVPVGSGHSQLLKAVKNALRAVPHDGVGYGALDRPGNVTPEVRFNYLGRFDATADEAAGLRPARYQPDTRSSGPADGGIPLDVTILALGDRLEIRWDHRADVVPGQRLAAIRGRWAELVRELVDICLTDAGVGPVPADFPLVGIDQAGLDQLLEELR